MTASAVLTPLALGAMTLSPALIPNPQVAQAAMTTSMVVMTVSAAAGIAADSLYNNNEDALLASAALAEEFRALR